MNWKFGIIGLLVAGSLWACGDDDKIEGTADNQDARLEIRPEEFFLPEKATEIAIGVNSNVEYNVIISSEATAWIKRLTTSAESDTLRFSISENPGTDDRIGYIVLSASRHGLRDTVSVTQYCGAALLLSKKNFEVSHRDTTLSVVVRQNVAYEVKVPENAKAWVSHTATRAMSTDTLVFDIRANTAYDVREAAIVVESEQFSDTLHIRQAELRGLILSDNKVQLGWRDTVVKVALLQNMDYQVKMPEEVDWLKKLSSKALAEDTIIFIVSANKTMEERTAAVVVERKDLLTDTIKVVQAKYDGYLLPQKEFTVPHSTLRLAVALQREENCEYKVSVPEEAKGWINYLETKAIAMDSLIFVLQRNESEKARTTKIYLEGNDVKDTLTVTQINFGKYPEPDRSLIPAFPGAAGGGRFTTGGAGGKVYTVTNLNDDGEGSLRWALKQKGRRTIVFAVSGVIQLKSTLKIEADRGDVTIAGQTAPGDGICLRDYAFQINASNVIIRYIRCRMGDEAKQENDAMWGREISDVIIDHCSMSWSTDECSSFYLTKNFTMQWCLISESLTISVHTKGNHGYGGIWGGEKASYHHNLMAHHSSRVPRIDGGRFTGNYMNEAVDIRNNVFYNWGPTNGGYGASGGSYNFVNNYFKPGASTNTKSGIVNRIFQPNADDGSYLNPKGIWGQFYVAGNYFDGSSPDLDSKYQTAIAAVNSDNWTGIHPNSKPEPLGDIESIKLYAPCFVSNDADQYTQTAAEAYRDVLRYVGASCSRDEVDARIVNDVKTGTYQKVTTAQGSKNGLIDSQSDVGGWPVYKSDVAPKDTDGDGMPDEWEISHGLNPADETDGPKYNLSPEYTNLEVYLNELTKGTFPL